MSSSTDQKIDWLHNLIRTSGDASNAVMTKQSLEARLRARNDQLYTQCVAGGGATPSGGFDATQFLSFHRAKPIDYLPRYFSGGAAGVARKVT